MLAKYLRKMQLGDAAVVVVVVVIIFTAAAAASTAQFICR